MKLQATPKFPGQVIAGLGIDVDPDLVVSVDYAEFPLVSPYTAQPGHYALVYDSVVGNFFLVPVTSLV